MKLSVHEFTLGDVDDPEIYAAQPIWEWQQTDCGKWVMENAVTEPYWCRVIDHCSYQIRYRLVAEFTDKDATYFCLRWK
jgi:hypothetical protein